MKHEYKASKLWDILEIFEKIYFEEKIFLNYARKCTRNSIVPTMFQTRRALRILA